MIRVITWNVCRIPVDVGNVIWSGMTTNTVEQHEADAAIERHRRWDWGEADTPQRQYNDKAAFFGGTVQSVYRLKDGRRLHTTTFTCRCGRNNPKGRVTLICLASEILRFGRCDCVTTNVPPHLWPQNNQTVPPSVVEAWETILFHVDGPWQ